MLVLFESAAGYALFKLLDEGKLSEPDELYKYFETPEKASKVIKLKHFEKFDNINEAVAGNLSVENDKVSKTLKKVIKKHVLKDAEAELAVVDAKLGKMLKSEYNVNCVSNSSIQELTRNIRSQLSNLISSSVQSSNIAQMSLGLAHSLGRYRLKFSPDKVDTMIVQAVSLLDDVDKELNNYIMRLREWYGWHFPELSKLVTDNLAYSQLVKHIGDRTNAMKLDLTEYLPEELEKEVKWAAEISMGTEIAEDDILNIGNLCEQVIEMSKTRDELYSYLKERMAMVAPNLTILVGELVGARLIAHAGSLLNLSKHPSSTVQILGAEKALFRALKSKSDTPKYGLIYHASLVGGATTKLKGKMSRMLAAKAALAIRVDALSETSDSTLGIEQRAKLEARVRALDQGSARKVSGTGKFEFKQEKYTNVSEVKTFSPKQDSTLPVKRKIKEEPEDDEQTTPVKPPKAKKIKKEVASEEEESTPKSSKKKKIKKEEADESMETGTPTSSKKKKKKKQQEEEEAVEEADTSSAKKKKKKKKKEQDSDSD